MSNPDATPRGLKWWYFNKGVGRAIPYSYDKGYRRWLIGKRDRTYRTTKFNQVLVPGRTFLTCIGNIQVFLPKGVDPNDLEAW